jgi:2-phosphosulfolactate phosphatase
MPKLEVCLSPELLHLHNLEGKLVIVIDIFRASSCMVAALAEGVHHIRPVASVEECFALGKQGYLMAGERNGETVSGFDLGNSPLQYADRTLEGRKVAMTTTNGTLALTKAARDAAAVWIGAFHNLSALSVAVKKRGVDTLLLCAGWKGKFSMEDSLFAGALAQSLLDTFTSDDDATLAAATLYLQVKDKLREYLQGANHYQRLHRLGVQDDLEFCLQYDCYPVVPVYGEGLIRLA